MEKRVCKQWEIWHNDRVDLAGVLSAKSQKCQLKLVEDWTGLASNEKYSIVEIGPGNGGLCSHILSKYSNSITKYTLVDAEFMINHSL